MIFLKRGKKITLPRDVNAESSITVIYSVYFPFGYDPFARGDNWKSFVKRGSFTSSTLDFRVSWTGSEHKQKKKKNYKNSF